MSAFEEYKKRRAEQLKNGATVRPTDFLDKQNHTTDEIAKMRMDICEACPKLVKLTKQCKECGCFMNLKTKLAGAACPIGKWDRV
jgi:hypothetical protein